MNVRVKESIGFELGVTYQRATLVEMLRGRGFTEEAKVEYPGSDSMSGFEARNKKPLDERFPDYYNFAFNIKIIEGGKGVRLLYNPAEGFKLLWYQI